MTILEYTIMSAGTTLTCMDIMDWHLVWTGRDTYGEMTLCDIHLC
jgi:hypothetical protein